MVSFQILSYEYKSTIRLKVALFFENYVCCIKSMYFHFIFVATDICAYFSKRYLRIT